MSRVVVAPVSVAMFPEGGGHFWVFLQWIQGLRNNGCDVYWLECLEPKYERQPDPDMLDRFLANTARVGMGDRVLVYRQRPDGGVDFVNVDDEVGRRVLDSADLLVDFKYDTPDEILSRPRRTALVDIDPGLLQFWLHHGQLDMADHDLYLTTGERIGDDVVPDCGLDWHRIRPVVDTRSWTFDPEPGRAELTTVTNWFGEWITDGADLLVDNAKRVEVLRMVDLPTRTDQPLELAVCFGDGEAVEVDRALLLENRWRLRHAFEVSGDPFAYRDYIRTSRGEFSCVKPSCLLFANAWISDRTLCYLASGRPAVVQHTGPSAYLPDAEGLFRFRTADEALAAFDAIAVDYPHHREAARALAETHFDATTIAATVLDLAA